MTIINLNTAIQTECVLRHKRKPRIYNVIQQYPVEIQDITKEETKLIALSFEYNEKYVTPYIEYNGKLYEPYTVLNETYHNNNNQIDENIKDIIEKLKSLTGY